MSTMVLVVTPMHNEEENVAGLHKCLARQEDVNLVWIVVNDGSQDRTGDELNKLHEKPIPVVIEKSNDGGLIGGSAYSSWRYGVAAGLTKFSDVSHVMKLDADVRLQPDYFRKVLAAFGPGVGLAGGVLVGRGHREQALHVPGPVKLYSRSAMTELEELPSAIGFDVMDEVALAEAGLRTVVVREASVELSRAIGASEGGLHGRFRNGRVCRWTGYDLAYFLLHVLRYVARRPYVIGSFAMVWGYVRASASPYAAKLRASHASMQRTKLRAAVRSPLVWYRDTYGY